MVGAQKVRINADVGDFVVYLQGNESGKKMGRTMVVQNRFNISHPLLSFFLLVNGSFFQKKKKKKLVGFIY